MPSTRWVRTALLGPRARFSLARSYAALERLIFAAAIGADPQTKVGKSTGYRGERACFGQPASGVQRTIPEAISMLTTVLERALAALPRQDRTEERKTRLASSILGAAARGERDPLLLYATALGGGPWEPAMGRVLLPSPLGPSTVKRPELRSPVDVGAASAASRPGG